MTSTAPTLLYIDDDADLARLVERGLKKQKFSVEHAADGASGLERIKAGGIDVIALDQNMPGLDGLETLKEILKISGAPPVVFVTASQDSKIAITALKAGAADYLPGERSSRLSSARPATMQKRKFMPRATGMRHSPPSAKCCCAKSIIASVIACRLSRRCSICRRIRAKTTA
jgi:CheY-like chemotaxis protein